MLLTAGAHTLFIIASTNDARYHFGAFYRFELGFTEACARRAAQRRIRTP